jgi:uncharacterized membrane protein YcaP (DUF421 family)
MDLHELLLTAVRAFALYVILLVLLRLMGKRTLGNFTAFDLLVTLMVGEVVDEIVYGDVPFPKGVTAILVVCALQYANSWMSARNPTLDHLLEGEPTPVVRGGRILTEGLRKEHMNESDLRAELRVLGVEDLGEVKLAMVETGGEVSVILEDWAQPLRRKDLPALAGGSSGA